MNKLNLKVTPQFPPPTWNPWNGSSGNCRHTNTSWNQKSNQMNNKSAPRLDRLFSSLASTGKTSNWIDQRGRYSREQNSSRLNSRSSKDENKTQQKMMNHKDSSLPRKRKNKFPVAVPWISPMSNPWRFPRSPAPTRTELEYVLWKMKNFSGRRNGRAPIWRWRIRSISVCL